MATEIITSFGQQCDANGVPMSGAKIYVYDVGTTTAKSLFSDKDLGVSAANPIVTDSSGRHDMRYIATGSYKVVVKTSADVSVYTRDNIDGRIPVGSGALAIANGGTSATTANGALAALGAATAAEVADLAADVAALAGAAASTEKTHIATGTTAQRPASPVAGDIRHNTTTTKYEGYIGGGFDNMMLESANATSVANVTSETAEATYIRPDRLKNSQRVAKAWGVVDYATPPVLSDSFGVTDVTRNGVGDQTINLSVTMGNANYACFATVEHSGERTVQIQAVTTTTVRLVTRDGAGGAANGTKLHFVIFGDLA